MTSLARGSPNGLHRMEGAKHSMQYGRGWPGGNMVTKKAATSNGNASFLCNYMGQMEEASSILPRRLSSISITHQKQHTNTQTWLTTFVLLHYDAYFNDAMTSSSHSLFLFPFLFLSATLAYGWICSRMEAASDSGE